MKSKSSVLINKYKKDIFIVFAIILFSLLEFTSFNITFINESHDTIRVVNSVSAEINPSGKDEIKFYFYDIWFREAFKVSVIDTNGNIKKDFDINLNLSKNKTYIYNDGNLFLEIPKVK